MITDKLALRNRIIGLLVRTSREQAKKSKRECAAALGLSTATFTAYEEGRRPISLPELEVLAYVFGTPTARLLEAESEAVTGDEEEVPLQEELELRHRIVGVLLRQARVEADISQKDLAEAAGCSASHLSAYEYGERPVPLAELELMAQRLQLPLEHFLDSQDGPVGEWHRQEGIWRRFKALPRDVQDFVVRPSNIKYLEVAMKLAQMPAGGLRGIAEGLLEITY